MSRKPKHEKKGFSVDSVLTGKAVLLKSYEKELLGLGAPTLSWQFWVVSNGQAKAKAKVRLWGLWQQAPEDKARCGTD